MNNAETFFAIIFLLALVLTVASIPPDDKA